MVSCGYLWLLVVTVVLLLDLIDLFVELFSLNWNILVEFCVVEVVFASTRAPVASCGFCADFGNGVFP